MSDRLGEALAKIERAKEQLRALNTAIEEGWEHELYGMRTELNDDGTEIVLTGFVEPALARRLGIIAGEVIHHARSALDYTIWQGIEATGATPNEGVTGFPVFTDEDEFEHGRKRLSGGRGLGGLKMITGVSGDVAKLVRGFQPFGPENDREPLWFLNELVETGQTPRAEHHHRAPQRCRPYRRRGGSRLAPICSQDRQRRDDGCRIQRRFLGFPNNPICRKEGGCLWGAGDATPHGFHPRGSVRRSRATGRKAIGPNPYGTH